MTGANDKSEVDLVAESILAYLRVPRLASVDDALAFTRKHMSDASETFIAGVAQSIYEGQLTAPPAPAPDEGGECGRLIDAIEEIGERDNTIVIYIAGDNGGTAIGSLNGTFNEWSNLNDAPEDIPYLKSRMHEYGGPTSYPNYSALGPWPDRRQRRGASMPVRAAVRTKGWLFGGRRDSNPKARFAASTRT
jgi:hypothetical protein